MAQWREFIKPMFDSDKPVIVAGTSTLHILKTTSGMQKVTQNQADSYRMKGVVHRFARRWLARFV